MRRPIIENIMSLKIILIECLLYVRNWYQWKEEMKITVGNLIDDIEFKVSAVFHLKKMPFYWVRCSKNTRA